MVDHKTRSFWSGAFLYRAYAGRIFRKMHRALIERVATSSPSSLLDIACGSGDFLLRIRETLPTLRTAGSDIAPGMLARARSALPSETTLVEAPADAQPFGAASFDVATTLMAFHHFPDPDLALREVHRLLAPQGTYFIADVVASSDRQKRWWNLLEKITGIRGHVGHYTDADMRNWAMQNGFSYESTSVPGMAKRYRLMTLAKL